MTPLAIEEKHYLSVVDQPVCVMGCGVVYSVDEVERSIVIYGTQTFSTLQAIVDFIVVLRTDFSSTELPTCSTIIGFSGTFVHFCDFNQFDSHSRARVVVVDVQDVVSF